MRFFVDTANVEDIRKANDMGVICGVTTNPSLIAKEGRHPQFHPCPGLRKGRGGYCDGSFKGVGADDHASTDYGGNRKIPGRL